MAPVMVAHPIHRIGNHLTHAPGVWLATPLQGELLGDVVVNAFSNEVVGGGRQKLGGLLQHCVKGKSFRYLPKRQKTFCCVVRSRRSHTKQGVGGSAVQAGLEVQGVL